MPHADKAAVIDKLVQSPTPILNKYRLYAALALDGEIIRANDVLGAIRAFFEEAKTKTWMLTERQWQVDAWLELLPLSDRPAATLEGVELVEAASQRPHRRERIVFGLGVTPEPEAEGTLYELGRRFPRLANAYEWMQAFVARGTASAIGRLLDFLQDANWPEKHDRLGGWALAQHIADLARANDAVKAELLARYRTATGQHLDALEFVLAEMGNPASTMAMVRSYARTGRPFDHRLHEAIRETALSKRPVASWYELHPVALTEMRRDLFRMLAGNPAELRSARPASLQSTSCAMNTAPRHSSRVILTLGPAGRGRSPHDEDAMTPDELEELEYHGVAGGSHDCKDAVNAPVAVRRAEQRSRRRWASAKAG